MMGSFFSNTNNFCHLEHPPKVVWRFPHRHRYGEIKKPMLGFYAEKISGRNTNSTSKTIQRKWNIFLRGEKENPFVAIATGVFYFEASRKKKRFIGWF